MNTQRYIVFYPILVCGVALGMACGANQPSSEAPADRYFPMSAFTATQAQLLDDKGLSFEKIALLDGDSARQTVQYDSTAWRKALKAWTALELNKPRLRGQYEADTVYNATTSSIRYTRKKDASYSVQTLVIDRDSLEQVRAIHGTLEEDKHLYTSFQELHAVFSSQGLLQRYTLWGYQKMRLADTIHYCITLQARP